MSGNVSSDLSASTIPNLLGEQCLVLSPDRKKQEDKKRKKQEKQAIADDLLAKAAIFETAAAKAKAEIKEKALSKKTLKARVTLATDATTDLLQAIAKA